MSLNFLIVVMACFASAIIFILCIAMTDKILANFIALHKKSSTCTKGGVTVPPLCAKPNFIHDLEKQKPRWLIFPLKISIIIAYAMVLLLSSAYAGFFAVFYIAQLL